jgi:hypothetical protein
MNDLSTQVKQLCKLQYLVTNNNINKLQKFYSLLKRYNKILELVDEWPLVEMWNLVVWFKWWAELSLLVDCANIPDDISHQ